MTDDLFDSPDLRGPWVAAGYESECDRCGEAIYPEDSIRSDGQGGWLCGECGEAR
jgi:formylmethanofuran dehydrogenase subunit E